jgi:DNA-binding TFAR19-related protein (PDSD5 family)
MAFSGMLRRVALVRTDVSEDLSASFIRVIRIGEIETTILVTLMKEALSSSETSILTRATRRNIPEYAVWLL